VAEELGTWPAEQATVLLEVLQQAGLDPDAKRTKDGVLVSVPADQSDEAHRQLVANMDQIAKAARQPKASGPPRSARKVRPVKGADNEPEKSPQQMASERLTRIAKPVALVLGALLLLGLLTRFPGGPLLGIIVVGGLVYFIGKRAQQRGGDDGRDGPR
jgi:hypothetical protein